jgi:signal transduction histidine kinase
MIFWICQRARERAGHAARSGESILARRAGPRDLRRRCPVRERASSSIHRDRAAEAVALWTDADRLSQVFINLISNAQKYCDAATPELTISVTMRGGRVEVEFADNGKRHSASAAEP